jgi:hypothetical protein
MKKSRRGSSEWTLDQLVAFVDTRLADPALPLEWSHPDLVENFAADLGHYDLLRAKYPASARHINPPKPERGKYRRKLKERPAALLAATADLPRVRKVLKERFGNKHLRYPGKEKGNTAALDVTAARWGVKVASLRALTK